MSCMKKFSTLQCQNSTYWRSCSEKLHCGKVPPVSKFFNIIFCHIAYTVSCREVDRRIEYATCMNVNMVHSQNQTGKWHAHYLFGYQGALSLTTKVDSCRSSKSHYVYNYILHSPSRVLGYLGSHNFPDGWLKLHGVVVVHCHDVRFANVLLCIRVLGGHLDKTHAGHTVRV